MATRVLIPLDGSKLAETALSELAALKVAGDLQVSLISVAQPRETATSDEGEIRDQQENLLRSYLRDVAGDIKEHLKLEADTLIAEGNSAEQILKVAQDSDIDLILISTHGRTGRERWRLGSVADKVIRGSTCDVFVLGPKAAHLAEWFAEITPPFRSILLPLDGSRLAEEAIPAAQRFLNSYQGTLHLVQVVSVPTHAALPAYPDADDALQYTARQYLESIRREANFPPESIEKVLTGSPANALLDYVDGNHIDLVVMTTHGRGGLNRSALGSVTDRMLSSPAPLLVVRPQAEE